MQPAQKTYQSIEGLRGILALIVCFGHFGLGTVILARYHIQFNINLAVDLFFVISGFVLAHSNYYAHTPVTTDQFLIKRIARLYPLHFAILAVVCLVDFVQGKPVEWFAFMENLFLVQNIGLFPAEKQFNFPCWSIAVELWASLLLLLLTKFVTQKRMLIIILISFITSLSLIFSSDILGKDFGVQVLPLVNLGLLRGLIGMCVGILLYLALQNKTLQKLITIKSAGYISLLSLVVYLFSSPWVHSSFGAILFYLCAFIFIGNVAFHQDFFKILSSKALMLLGAISYSIYLLHIPVYFTVYSILGDENFRTPLGYFIRFATVFISARLSYKYLELPAQKLLRHYFLNKKPQVTNLYASDFES